MKIRKIATAIAVALLVSACSVGGGSDTLSNSSTDPLSNSSLGTTGYNPLSTTPSSNLFNTTSGYGTLNPVSTTATTTTAPIASGTAAQCVNGSSSWTPISGSTTTATGTWSCLNNQAASGNITPDTVTDMAAASFAMMNNCGLAVRAQLIPMMSQINPNDPNAVGQLFQFAEQALTQCYFELVQSQAGSLGWSPYQQQVMNYNSGNIYNMLSGFSPTTAH